MLRSSERSVLFIITIEMETTKYAVTTSAILTFSPSIC